MKIPQPRPRGWTQLLPHKCSGVRGASEQLEPPNTAAVSKPRPEFADCSSGAREQRRRAQPRALVMTTVTVEYFQNLAHVRSRARRLPSYKGSERRAKREAGLRSICRAVLPAAQQLSCSMPQFPLRFNRVSATCPEPSSKI